jgi:hypothetical protein
MRRINRKTKKIIVLALIAAASAAVISFLIFLLPQIYESLSRVPLLKPHPGQSSGDNLIITSSSIRLDLKRNRLPTSTPSGFKGPTDQPHVNGPTSPPPNY